MYNPERIMTNRLDRGYQRFQGEFEEAALRVLRSGYYILGEELEQFFHIRYAEFMK